MRETINIYCDESCHLEHDDSNVMVLGAVWCPTEKSWGIAKRIREIKEKHHLSKSFEIKWTKVSQGKLQFYLDLIDFFFDDDDLRFRALIIPDKAKLNHKAFCQDHNTFYYKMYFSMLKILLSPNARYRIFLDIKDTCGADKVRHLRDVLSSANYDFQRSIVSQMQLVRSHEVEQQQLADLLIGCIAYRNRGLTTSQAKLALINRMTLRSGYQLTRTTLAREEKVNLFRWHGREEQD